MELQAKSLFLFKYGQMNIICVRPLYISNTYPIIIMLVFFLNGNNTYELLLTNCWNIKGASTFLTKGNHFFNAHFPYKKLIAK